MNKSCQTEQIDEFAKQHALLTHFLCILQRHNLQRSIPLSHPTFPHSRVKTRADHDDSSQPWARLAVCRTARRTRDDASAPPLDTAQQRDPDITCIEVIQRLHAVILVKPFIAERRGHRDSCDMGKYVRIRDQSIEYSPICTCVRAVYLALDVWHGCQLVDNRLDRHFLDIAGQKCNRFVGLHLHQHQRLVLLKISQYYRNMYNQ